MTFEDENNMIIEKILKKESEPGFILTKEITVFVLHFCCLMAMDIYFRGIFEKNNTVPIAFWQTLLVSGFWCLIIAAISLLLPVLIRRIYIVLSTLVFAVLVFVHALLDSFFGQYMSFSSLIFADDGARYFEWEYFDVPANLIVVLVLCVLLSVGCAIVVPKKTVYRKKAIVALAVVLVSSVGVGITSDRFFADDFGGITWSSTKSNADYYDEFSDYRYCMHLCGLYHYTFRDIYVSTGLKDSVDKTLNSSRVSELDSYYASKELDLDNDMTGLFKDKNLILIQLESIDSWMVNETAMPTFSALLNKGISFSNFYAPKYLWAATFSSELAVNTGILTPMNSNKMSYYTENDYPFSLPNLFKEAGYTVNSFHQSGRSTYNRGDIHENWGYEKYNAAQGIGMSSTTMDTAFLEVYDLICPDEKFMSFVITITGHGPYTEDKEAVKKYEKLIRQNLPDDAKDEYVWALCHAYETDMFIKGLIDKLEADGKLEDTALIFYTDHYDHYITDEDMLHELKGTDDTNLMGNVPCLIYAEDIEPMTVDKPIASFDLTPTIVNLFGLDCDGRYYIGNDAFSENGGYIIFRDMSWYDGEIYFNVKNDAATDRSKEMNDQILERLRASWSSVRFNYFSDK